MGVTRTVHEDENCVQHFDREISKDLAIGICKWQDWPSIKMYFGEIAYVSVVSSVVLAQSARAASYETRKFLYHLCTCCLHFRKKYPLKQNYCFLLLRLYQSFTVEPFISLNKAFSTITMRAVYSFPLTLTFELYGKWSFV